MARLPSWLRSWSLSLLTKLLLAILVPSVITFAGFAALSHYAAARAVEDELGRTLSGVAAVIATQASPDQLGLLGPGDEETRTYRNLRKRLLDAQAATGVARVYLFSADRTVRVDTDGTPIGTRDYSLESSRAELKQLFTATAGGGGEVSSVLFRGRSGRLYKSGYARVGSSSFAVGVDGNAAIYENLLSLRKTLFGAFLVGVLAMVALAVILGRRLTHPLRRLRIGARQIGSGVFDEPIPLHGKTRGDEVFELSHALESMRTALRARDEHMQMMLAGIAHEVRNPLGGMELFAGLLDEELQAAEAAPASLDLDAARGYVARVKKELKHLQAVVSDFLEFARRPRPVLAKVALRELLQEVAESAQAAAPPEQVRVEVLVLDGPAVSTLADHNQLRRALQNLAHNAVQATLGEPGARPPPSASNPEVPSAPKTVELSCATVTDEEGGTFVELRVRDHGPGIPSEVLEKIWTPFFTTRAQGTGLGLSFVHEIVKDHGGSLAVDTGPTGTEFRLRLPTSPTPAPPAGPRPP